MIDMRNQSQSENDLLATFKAQQKNLSSMSTNPSTSQVNVRNPKQSAVSLKQALQNQGNKNNMQQQQKHLLVLNQRSILNPQQPTSSNKKIPIMSSRNPGQQHQ